MKHITSISAPMTANAVEKQDEIGYIFLQIWLTVMSMMLSKAFMK